MFNKKNNLLSFIVVVGSILPFVPFLVFLELLFLPLLGWAFLGALLNVVDCFFRKQKQRLRALFYVSLVPFFLFIQLFSGWVVHTIQRHQSASLIHTIEKANQETRAFPVELSIPIGIVYKKLNNGFLIEYSRGFMVTEQYDSRQQQWKSYGWNH